MKLTITFILLNRVTLLAAVNLLLTILSNIREKIYMLPGNIEANFCTEDEFEFTIFFSDKQTIAFLIQKQ